MRRSIAHQTNLSDSPQAIRFHRRSSDFFGAIYLLIGALGLVVGVAGLVRPSADENRPQGLLVAAMGAFFAYGGIRRFILGIKVTEKGLIIHNELRTRVVPASDCRAITLEPRTIGEGLPRWIARVHLADGSCIWMDALDCGSAYDPPDPARVATVDDVAVLLGVHGEPLEFAPGSPEQSVADGSTARIEAAGARVRVVGNVSMPSPASETELKAAAGVIAARLAVEVSVARQVAERLLTSPIGAMVSHRARTMPLSELRAMLAETRPPHGLEP